MGLHQMRVGQLTMLVIGVLGIVAALFIAKTGGAFDFGLKYYSLTGPGFMMPVFLGMIYRKTPWWSGMASSIAALCIKPPSAQPIARGRERDEGAARGALPKQSAGKQLEQRMKTQKVWDVTVSYPGGDTLHYEFAQDPGFQVGDVVRKSEQSIVRY